MDKTTVRGAVKSAERTEAEELKRVKAELTVAIKAMQTREALRIARLKFVAVFVLLVLFAFAGFIFTS
jgi:hypothetical protein